MQLQEIKGWLFDLDGVIWAGEDPMPGAADLVAALRKAGRQVAFLSNNSGATAESLAQRIGQFGIMAETKDVISPIAAAGRYLAERYGKVKVLASGLPALAAVLAESGHTPVTDPYAAEAVVMGRNYEFTYDSLTTICRAVDRGIPFLALNKDARLPVEGGAWVPGLGAMVAAVVAATGREPLVVGKPSRLLFDTALAYLGTAPGETVMVGDTPAADIAGGRNAGMWTIKVGNAAGEPEAHWQVSDPAELLRLWQA
ncbi:MAG: HAD-IIA family hydrolase [Mycobacterium leprae]